MFGFLRRFRREKINRNPIDPSGIQRANQNVASSWGIGASGSSHPVKYDGKPLLQRPRPKARRL
jgi:hypothetical protein